MQLDDFLQNKDVPLEIRIGTLLASAMGFGDIGFVAFAQTLLEEAHKRGQKNTELCERLEKAKRNREIKIKKNSQN